MPLLQELTQTVARTLRYEDFVIDEAPVEIEPPAAGAPAAGDAQTAETALLDAEDFLTQISAILGENEKLLGLNQELERTRPGAEELEKFIRKFLPHLDSFERILYSGRDFPRSEEVENWLKAIETLYFRIKDYCEKWGLVEMKCIGHSVDFNLHEVIEIKYTPDHPADTIIAECQKGYVFRGKVLRDAQVVVAARGN